ncbi:MAG TPA: AMP-binding protein [Falsiroseomonas sp.]|jgi:fatty-acyl-CoA synthase|nr:AMP-binding protein [Falsiroseomonas sp.]
MQDWPGITYDQALDRSAELWGMQEAMVAAGERLTHASFRERVHLVAANLLRLGVRRGEHVAVCMGNRIEWAVTFFAAARIGAVTVPVNTRFKSAELEYCLEQSDAVALVVADRFLGIDFIAMLRAICPGLDTALPSPALPKLRCVVVLGEDVPAAALPFAALMQAADNTSVADPPAPDDPVLIQYTSGTTSFPKGAMLTHDGMLRDAWHVANRLGLDPHSRYYSARPLYHVAGTTLSLVASVVSGACYITTAHFDVAEGLRLLEEERCTHTSGNDTMFLMMMGHPDFPVRRPKLRLRGGMAAASTTVLQQLVEEMGMRGVCSGYGLSEASPNCACGPWHDDPQARLDGYATPLPGVEIRILDPDTGSERPAGSPGEILVRGWNIMQGYYNMPEQTARAIDGEGWLHTGDFGVKDAAGRLRFSGRLKDTFRVGGENVAPAEVEDVLHRHPAIEQAQVIGVPDPRLVEVPAAYVVLRAGAGATPEEIIAWCRERCANFRVPRYVRVVDGFERIGMTGSSKVQKSKLREFALDDLGL